MCSFFRVAFAASDGARLCPAKPSKGGDGRRSRAGRLQCHAKIGWEQARCISGQWKKVVDRWWLTVKHATASPSKWPGREILLGASRRKTGGLGRGVSPGKHPGCDVLAYLAISVCCQLRAGSDRSQRSWKDWTSGRGFDGNGRTGSSEVERRVHGMAAGGGCPLGEKQHFSRCID